MMRTIIILCTATLLAGCTTLQVTPHSEGVMIKTEAPVLIVDANTFITTSENLRAKVCGSGVEGLTGSDSELDAQEAFKLLKDIYEWWPKHVFTWTGSCP